MGRLRETNTNTVLRAQSEENLNLSYNKQRPSTRHGCMLGLFHGSYSRVHHAHSCHSYRMTIHKLLRLSQRRSVISSLFGLTFIATCLTVSASNILPCPVRPDRARFADSDNQGPPMKNGRVKVVKRPRRWIEEKTPE